MAPKKTNNTKKQEVISLEGREKALFVDLSGNPVAQKEDSTLEKF